MGLNSDPYVKGAVNGVPVRMERLQTLIPSACMEHLDFLDEEDTNMFEFMALKELETDNSQYKSLSDLPKSMMSIMGGESINPTAKLEDFFKLNLNELIAALHSTQTQFTKALIMHELINRFGMKLQIQEHTIDEMFAQLAVDAAALQNWRTVRYCSSILHKTVDSLAPSITNILVRGEICRFRYCSKTISKV